VRSSSPKTTFLSRVSKALSGVGLTRLEKRETKRRVKRVRELFMEARFADALQVLDELRAAKFVAIDAVYFDAAICHASLGDDAAAMKSLRRAVRHGYSVVRNFEHPAFARLADTDEFISLLSSLLEPSGKRPQKAASTTPTPPTTAPSMHYCSLADIDDELLNEEEDDDTDDDDDDERLVDLRRSAPIPSKPAAATIAAIGAAKASPKRTGDKEPDRRKSTPVPAVTASPKRPKPLPPLPMVTKDYADVPAPELVDSRTKPLYELAAPSSALWPSAVAAKSVTRAWQIDPADVELGATIGQGHFGVVRRAQWRGRTVAVKQIKKASIGADDKAVADFEDEIGRMATMQPHENLVHLQGIMRLPNGDLAAVVEFCAQGALVDALYGPNARNFDGEQLSQIAYDAACGLLHLHANDVVHRDVAARNVLLAGRKDLVAKLSDFGMARDVSSAASGAEHQTETLIGPVRWMAPEQLTKLSYSRASDVFAFGVLLFEIFAGEAPWAGVSNIGVITQVVAGRRMAVPFTAPLAVRQVMEQCWLAAAADRPNMKSVCAKISPATRD
jgi:hypothetical protein